MISKKNNTRCVDDTNEEEVEIVLSSRDLEANKDIAYNEGLPYQTLISSLLHKFVLSHS